MADDVSAQILSIEERPGLFDTLGTPESLVQLNRFLESSGVAGQPVAKELRMFAPPETAHLSTNKWKNISKKLREFFISRPVRIEAEQAVWIPVDVHGLYCPSIPGSKASLSVERGNKEKATCEVSIFGIGGGHEFKVEFTVADEFTVDAQNVVVQYLIQGAVAKCVIDASEGPQSFLRLERVQRRLQRVQVLPVTPPGPHSVWGEAIMIREYDLRTANVSNKFSLEHAVESKWEASPGLKIESLGLEATVEYAATKKWKTVFTYELPAGHLFQARVFANRCFMSALS